MAPATVAVAAPSARHALRIAATQQHQRTPLRSFASASSSSSSSSSNSATSPSSSSRAARRSSRFSARPGADLVGPPDPLSNLRPVKYGSAFDEAPSSVGASASAVTMSITHPYSLSEFNPAASSFAAAAARPRGHSLYFERLLERLEEAELAHKLRSARADNFNQRFWQDNNARFIQALHEFRSRTTSSKAVATLKSAPAPAPASAPINTNAQESELDIDSDTLATFYSAWLKANATRHRAYNRQLWAQTFGDLAPAFRYQSLRTWAKLVGAVERRLGWH
ncbi:uncharacterized protein PFL1_01976 [Pseudozyma flocculosa PF-1]|uniref:Uncharacterized protein n=1 Tax=Pseudozyma flocculosa TaxID=84751 RepID=A0A5C3F088_9BASI|nr:uncharacterized protein PFL1_01976 [Pseudozyma flocculosa PF-1]EPQ30450.1 hypothetical protein PFL1_01976 [Pseudozyma flocculosa PF-1]SPO37530.1 uncharacterized protein PSFLO_03005 [Pseudozyma flocculosa]